MIHPAFISNDDLRRMIRAKAATMIGRSRFRTQDREDLEQDLWLWFLKGLANFDSGRGSHKQFVSKVLAHRRASILRDKSAQKRDAGEAVSVACPDMPEVDRCNRTGRSTLSEEEYLDLKLDLEAILAKLAPDSRKTAELLKQHSTAETARRLGLPRTPLISKLGPEGAFRELHRVFA